MSDPFDNIVMEAFPTSVEITDPNIPPVESNENIPFDIENNEINNIASPLSSTITNFKPITTSTIIGEISPADFDNMVKVLNVLIKEKATDSIIIRQSQVKQGNSGCVIWADMTKILHYNSKFIDLDIINPKKYVASFSQFKNQNNIFIIDDNENSRFIVTNGEIKLFLPKQDNLQQQNIDSVDFTNATLITTRMIDKETRKIIKNLSKDQEYVEYLFQDNLLKAMHIPDTAIYLYEEFQKDANANKLDETNSELTLRSSNFLPIDAEGYTIQIIKLQDDTYVVMTECKIGGQINVKIIEQCQQTTGGNVII